MSSKADRAAAASNHEKNKKKLSRTITKVVKNLSTLNLDEKNDQLRVLQQQLRSLDKQLVKNNKEEAAAEKAGSKTRAKKPKKEKKRKESDDGGQPLGSYRLLPLGICVKDQVKSKVVSSNLNNAVSRRTKTTLKETSPKSKNKSSQHKCTKLVSDYLAFESETNVESQKKSKKEKKKLKTLKEIGNKMEKNCSSGHKFLSSIKLMEKNFEKSKRKSISETSSPNTQTMFSSTKEKKTNSEKSETSSKKSSKEPGVIKFSNYVSLSEQYYFLTAIEGGKNEKCSASNTSKQSNTIDGKTENVDTATKKPKKNRKKKQQSTSNEVNIGSASAKIAVEINDLEIQVSKLTVSENPNIQGALVPEKKKKKKKKGAKVVDDCTLSSLKNTAEKPSSLPVTSSNIENTSCAAVNFSKVEPKEKKKMSKHGKKKNKDSKVEEDNFEPYWSEQIVFNGLRDGALASGQLRINARDYTTAYVTAKLESESDYLIEGIRDRNRALEGDIVALYVLPENMWKSTPSGMQKTAKVVYIQEPIHSRRGIGVLKVMADKNPDFALFSPNDSRLPRWQVPMYCCPADFYKNPSKYKNVYFEGILTNWITPKISHGFVTEILGEKGTIEAETMSLLCEADCDVTPIPQSLFEATLQDIVFDERILENRQDLRRECIFSIDPEGAKDLDDALSCRKLPNGNYEIGVHISDVSFYIPQGTQFDKLVCQKATTVYLVQRAYHMLPQELCYLCSLTPGEDKLAFSVFWELTPSAEILSHRFTRSIIHSCVQLTYTHAQKVIENPEATSYDFPPIMNGFSEKDCAERILQLHHLAAILRKSRFDGGCLRIEIPKLWFKLDSTGLPTDCSLYQQHESNWLIEEFMLLANFTVARHIYQTYPDIALLRQHKHPNMKALVELKKSLDKENIFIDINSGATLLQSINQFDGSDFESEAKRIVLSNLVAKPMPKALYYASGLVKEASDMWHFALNTDYYTHFTSPIRRYADIIVHRLLAASLGYCAKPAYTEQEVQKAASISNKQKYCAKRAGELSSKLFLTLHVAAHGPFIEKAAVLDIKDHSFDCVVLRFGYIARVYTNNLSAQAEIAHQSEDGSSSILVYWKENTQKNIKASIQLIKLFSVVTIELKKSDNDIKLETKLLPFY